MHKHVAMDAWQGKPVHGVALQFCQLYQFGRSGAQRFDVSLYGSEGALIMARYYVAKMTFLFQHWVNNGAGEQFIFPGDVGDGFEEPEAFSQFAVEQTNARIVQRVGQLRDLLPTLRDD